MECGTWNEEDWGTLIYTIQRGNCLLMLGPDAAVEDVDEQPQPLTALLAKELFEKLRPEIQQNLDPSNLAQVAQYYRTERGRNDLEARVFSFYDARWPLDSDLHRHLATLPFYFTIMTTWDNMFCNALREEKKPPVIEDYNFRGENPEMVQVGTVNTPLVFYLYGTIEEPESLVLTENDLIDFLAAVVAKNPPLPRNILSELRNKNKSLLFLGFGFKHWYLRILLHILQGHDKESRSFALEQLPPRNFEEFQRTILFFSTSDYKITICAKELQGFVKELRERYEKSISARSPGIPGQYGPTVFICHVRDDREHAGTLYKHLETAGFRRWQGLEVQPFSDDDLEQAIKKGIDYVVVLQSSAMLQQYESSLDERRLPQEISEKAAIMMNFGQKLKLIQHNLDVGGYTIAAKECVGLIEHALRHLFSQHLTRLEEKDRLGVQKAELEIGKGSKGIESFTMGQLVGVFRTSHFLDAWARASGKDLSGIRVINLDELTALRNTFIHGDREASDTEAKFLFDCLHVILETFELKPTEAISPELSDISGFPQYSCKKVIRLALERQQSCSPGTSFIIPVKIEDCPVLQELQILPLQTIDLSKGENVKMVVSAIKRDQQRRKRR
jgi:hypothetical protein